MQHEKDFVLEAGFYFILKKLHITIIVEFYLFNKKYYLVKTDRAFVCSGGV